MKLLVVGWVENVNLTKGRANCGVSIRKKITRKNKNKDDDNNPDQEGMVSAW